MARFEVNVSGIGELARSDGARRATNVLAEALEVRVAANHRSDRDRTTKRGRGNILRSLGRETELDAEGWVVHVGYLKGKHASASFGHLVEFGSVNNAPMAPIRTGVQQSGLRWDPS